MGRFTRVVAVDVPHHVTQRRNGRRFVLDGDADRTIYLKLLRENIVRGVALIGQLSGDSIPIRLSSLDRPIARRALAIGKLSKAVTCRLVCHLSPRLARPCASGKLFKLPA
jgi:hypothetical protein